VSAVPLRVAILGVNYERKRVGSFPTRQGLPSGSRELATRSVCSPAVRIISSGASTQLRQAHEFEVQGGVSVRRLRRYIPSKRSGEKRACFKLAFGSRLATVRWGQPDVVTREGGGSR
jgi:hypothetical protein